MTFFLFSVLQATPGFPKAAPLVWIAKKAHLKTLKTPLRDFPVSAQRWVVTESVYDKSGGELVDLETQKVVELPWFSTLAGFPATTEPAPGPQYAQLVAALKAEGKYSKWLTWEWVSLDGEKNTGWIWARQQKTLRRSPEPPACADGKPAKLIAENQRFYCLSSRTWVAPESYLKEVTESWLLAADLGSRKITATRKVADEALLPVGVDPTGTFFLAGTSRIFLEREAVSGPVTIFKVPLDGGAIEPTRVDLPPRRKTPGVYAVVYVPLPDFSRVFVREHDEKKGDTTGGFLQNPTARGQIADLKTHKTLEFDVPVDVRAAVFSKDHKYLFMDSPVLSTVTRLTLADRRLTPLKTPLPGHFLALSSRDRLYHFHQDGVTVYDLDALAPFATVPRAKFWPAGAMIQGRNLSLAGGHTVVMGQVGSTGLMQPSQLIAFHMY